MRLVSDFDGVWTEPGAEAIAQAQALERTLVAWAPAELQPQVHDWLIGARAAVAAAPTRYGWAPGGQLSAFGDEDPFTALSGLLHYVHLAAAHDTTAAALREAVEARGLSLERLGSQTHSEGVKQVVASRGPGVLPSAARAGHAMLAHGIDIVVVSNSGPDKLGAWFAHAGLPATIHPDRAAGALRLRGDSRKFALDPARREPLVLDGISIETARPRYAQVLREERPTAIVGDVFSLDLALPLALKRGDSEWRGVRLFWLLQPYTPAWLRAKVEALAAGEVEPIEGGLPAVATALGATL